MLWPVFMLAAEEAYISNRHDINKTSIHYSCSIIQSLSYISILYRDNRHLIFTNSLYITPATRHSANMEPFEQSIYN